MAGWPPSSARLIALCLFLALPASAAGQVPQGQLPRDVPADSLLSQSAWDDMRARQLRRVGRALQFPVLVLVGWGSGGEHAQCLGASGRMRNLVEGELRRAGASPILVSELIADMTVGTVGSTFNMDSVVGVQNGLTCVVAYRLSWTVHRPEDGDLGLMWYTGLRLVWEPRRDSPQRLRAIIREHVAELGDFLANGLSRLAEDAAGR